MNYLSELKELVIYREVVRDELDDIMFDYFTDSAEVQLLEREIDRVTEEILVEIVRCRDRVRDGLLTEADFERFMIDWEVEDTDEIIMIPEDSEVDDEDLTLPPEWCGPDYDTEPGRRPWIELNVSDMRRK
jgi:hypothetical protein